jgi:two-component system, OmpR family, sensor histidine kinase VicK
MAIRTDDTNNCHNNNETTEVLRGVGNVINAELQFFANSKKMVGTCMNCTRPQLAIIIEPIRKAFIDAKSRGVKLRYITEITRDNISACKELMTIVDDLRHLEGIKGNFMVSDNQYVAPIILFEEGKVASQIVFSNVKELVEQEQYTFDIFWSKAIPAQDKIREIEENISIQKTQLIYGHENTTNTILQALYKTKKSWDACIESRTAAISMGNILKKGYLDARKRGVKIRYITEFTKDNIQVCKEIAKVAELRHLEGIKANFGVSETEYADGINVSQQENLVLLDHLIYSNVTKLVQQQKYIFETLWNKSLPYEQKIREIEEGVLPIRTRVLEDEVEIIKEVKRRNNSANKLSICSGFGGMQLGYKYFFDSYKEILYKSGEAHDVLRWIISIDKGNIKLVKIFLELGFQIKHIRNMLPLSCGLR